MEMMKLMGLEIRNRALKFPINLMKELYLCKKKKNFKKKK